MALVHHPVVNKNGETIASAVTNLDLHDIARLARTYDLKRFFVVTPLHDQQTLVQRIVTHWTTGAGAQYNPKRCEALKLIRVVDSLADASARIFKRSQVVPRVIVTSARAAPNNVTFAHLRGVIADGKPVVLTFGTAWGVTAEFMAEADFCLEPIKFGSTYNHLSVRCAAAIALDRLLAR